MHSARRTAVRMVAVSATLLLMTIYASVSSEDTQSNDLVRGLRVDSGRRRLLHNNESLENPDCARPMHQANSCQYVREYCSGDVELVNYLSLIACQMPQAKVIGYILLGAWLLYLISLLATTAENFFIPPLTLLANKLRFSPSIAGITLLAFGNSAPDVFTAYSAIQRDNFALLLGTLTGAAMFITTVVLATIILFFRVTSKTIDKPDFMRDIIALMLVIGIIIGVAFDQTVTLYEAIIFPLLYIFYITIVISLSFFRKWLAKWLVEKRSRRPTVTKDDEDADKGVIRNESYISSCDESTSLLSADQSKTSRDSIGKAGASNTSSGHLDSDSTSADEEKNLAVVVEHEMKQTVVELPGLTWPPGRCISRDCSCEQMVVLLVKFQWALELPFSILRWLTVPPCCHNGKWSVWHKVFAVIYPAPAALLLAVAINGWDGFTEWTVADSKFPYIIFFIILGMLLSVLLFFLVSRRSPPRWPVQVILSLSAFITAICWLSIFADEIVSVLEALGFILDIDAAVLGMTVLAVGNSVGDWVADVVVAKNGEPGMAVAACFGAPVFAHVIGLSVSLVIKIGIDNKGEEFNIHISDGVYDRVKLSWIFLGIVLLMSTVVFPVFKFSPPKAYGIVLIYIYIVFLVFSILSEVEVMNIHF